MPASRGPGIVPGSIFASAIAGALLLNFSPASAQIASPLLWQERYYFDALLQARSRQSRSESDPRLVPVLRSISGEVFQQTANLGQIDSYVKAQEPSLRYAFAQGDPGPSLKIIGANLDTLAQGTVQVENNLAYLGVRCRLASSQALPDSEAYRNALLILAQVRDLQTALNGLYTDSEAAEKLIDLNSPAVSDYFRYQAQALSRGIKRLQEVVFSLYNSGYDLALRCR